MYKRDGIYPLIPKDAWPKFDSNWKEGAMPETPEGQILALLKRLDEATNFSDGKADWMVDALKRKKVQYDDLKDEAPFTYKTLYWGAQKDGEINDEIIKKCYEEILTLCAKKYPHKVTAATLKAKKEAEKKRQDDLVANYKRQVELQKELEQLRIEYRQLSESSI